jgi:hypothetical protein
MCPVSRRAFQRRRVDLRAIAGKEGRVHPHEEQAGQQEWQSVSEESIRGQHHDPRLDRLDDLQHLRFIQAVGNLPSNPGKQHERKDEQSAGQVYKHLRIDVGVASSVVGGSQ